MIELRPKIGAPRRLSPELESWLRQHIPAWGSLRDRAVAAGRIALPPVERPSESAAIIARIRGQLSLVPPPE